jgi:hypothetical protein
MSNFYEKLGISVYSGILFALINLPAAYAFTNQNVQDGLVDASGCPTPKGILIHTIVFLVLSFLTMGNPFEETFLKLKYSIYGSLLFFLFSNPVMYSVTSQLTGGLTATESGCQTNIGVLVHAVVYTAALVGLMYLPQDRPLK